MQKIDKLAQNIEYIHAQEAIPEPTDEVIPHKHFYRDIRDGFKIYSSVPTHDAPNGTMLLYENGATRAIYVRINTGWFSASVA